MKKQFAALLLSILFVSAAFGQDVPGTLKFPTELDTLDSLFRTTDRAASFLTSGINASVDVIPLNNASGFPSSGAIVIGNEVIFYTAKSANTLTGAIRGASGTTAASHISASQVRGAIVSAHHNTQSQALINLQTKLGFGSSTATSGTFLKGTGAGTSAWSPFSLEVGVTESNGTANTLFKTNATGEIADAVGVTTPTGGVLQAASQGATDDVLRVQLAASQSGNAIEILPNGSATPLSHFAANGSLNIANLGTNVRKINLGTIAGDAGIHFTTGNGSGFANLSTFGNDTIWRVTNSSGGWVFDSNGTSSGFQIHEGSVLAVGLNGTTRTWFNSNGAAVVSAAAIMPTGNLFHVTGTTTITSITSTGVTAGTRITIIFDSTAQMTNGGNLIIGSDFTGGANRSITLDFDGTNWYQASRSEN